MRRVSTLISLSATPGDIHWDASGPLSGSQA